MNRKRNWIKVLSLWLILSLSACNTAKKQEDMSVRCCRECLEAFSQSPVAVGAEGAGCGAFTTAKPISNPCREYFKKNPRTVAECE